MTPRKPSMQSLGGLARAAKLTPKQRTDSARKARLAQSPEVRHAAILKGWETRRAKKARKNES